MEGNLEQITLDIPDGYEFFGINNDNEVVLTKIQQKYPNIQPKYPKTYVECQNILHLADSARMARMLHKDYAIILEKLSQLLFCRDAYWKIAGEQIGLGKPWKPDWNDDYQDKWIINFYRDDVNPTDAQNVHFVLAFPTEEMRDAFFENFKDLIEECKELL